MIVNCRMKDTVANAIIQGGIRHFSHGNIPDSILKLDPWSNYWAQWDELEKNSDIRIVNSYGETLMIITSDQFLEAFNT